MKKIKNFIVNTVAIILILLGIKKGLEIYAKINDKRDDTIDGINERNTNSAITEFRDRSGFDVRRVFDNRGHRIDEGDSRRADSYLPSETISGVSGIPPERNEGEEFRDTTMAGGDVNRNSDSAVRGFIDGPIKLNNYLLLRYIEGAVIRRNGGRLLALLAPQQLKNGALTPSELIEIYRQARKDPLVMTRDCILGRKHTLITYHNKYIMGIDDYLEEVNDKEKIRLGIYDYEIREWDDKYYTLYNNDRHEVFDPHDGQCKREHTTRRWFYRLTN